MSPRKYLKHLGLLATLAVSAAIFTPSGAFADTEEDALADTMTSAMPLIVVQGSGEVRVRPDSLTVDFGVEARAPSVDQARRQVNVSMQHVLDAVRALNLESLTMQTSVVQVSPIYATQHDNQPPRIVGYSASNHVTARLVHVPVDDLGNRGAAILDAALGAGANTTSGMSFFLADPRPAQDEALAAAVHAAQHDAQTVADASGVTLGALHSVEVGTIPRFGGGYAGKMMMAAAPEAGTPIEVDMIVVHSDVTARFTFH